MSATGTRGAWYPDPYRRHELRFHDGELWTEHVSDRGVCVIDTTPVSDGPRSRPPDHGGGAVSPPVAAAAAARVLPAADPATSLLDATVLVVDELARGHAHDGGLDLAVADQHGRWIGTVRVAHEPLAARALRRLAADDQRQVSRVDLLDPTGQALLVLRRPARLLVPKVLVETGDGTPIGSLVPRRRRVQIASTLEADGRVLATVVGRPPQIDLSVVDADGADLARISRTWEVPSAQQHLAPGTHVVLLDPRLVDPLRALTVAALLGFDTMLAHDRAGPH